MRLGMNSAPNPTDLLQTDGLDANTATDSGQPSETPARSLGESREGQPEVGCRG
jgi:hypothetical protein